MQAQIKLKLFERLEHFRDGNFQEKKPEVPHLLKKESFYIYTLLVSRAVKRLEDVFTNFPPNYQKDFGQNFNFKVRLWIGKCA
ncbi:hypothetical protein PHSC3_000129 [Chlamydiales bacterium STE3]|nr:hypothetical protein PHSC3_000129 [Chlamydiales bacterium STE3]